MRELIAMWLHWPIGCAPVLKAIPLHILWSSEW